VLFHHDSSQGWWSFPEICPNRTESRIMNAWGPENFVWSCTMHQPCSAATTNTFPLFSLCEDHAYFCGTPFLSYIDPEDGCTILLVTSAALPATTRCQTTQNRVCIKLWNTAGLMLLNKLTAVFCVKFCSARRPYGRSAYMIAQQGGGVCPILPASSREAVYVSGSI
jgi:hypothetical protein